MARPKKVLVPATSDTGKGLINETIRKAVAQPLPPVAAQETPQAPVKAKEYVKVYTVQLDGILKPDGTGEWSGEVTEAELRAGGAAFDWLLGTGRIKETSVREVA